MQIKAQSTITRLFLVVFKTEQNAFRTRNNKERNTAIFNPKQVMKVSVIL